MIAEGFFGDGHGLCGLVFATTSDGVDCVVVACLGDWDGDVPKEDTDSSEGGVAGGYTRVVRESLVAGEAIKVVGAHVGVVSESTYPVKEKAVNLYAPGLRCPPLVSYHLLPCRFILVCAGVLAPHVVW